MIEEEFKEEEEVQETPYSPSKGNSTLSSPRIKLGNEDKRKDTPGRKKGQEIEMKSIIFN